MGGVHSTNSQAECVAWQQQNPTKECDWPGDCGTWYIEKAGDKPVFAISASCITQSQTGSSQNQPVMSDRRRRRGCPNNTLLWVGIGILAVGLLIVCQRSQKKK